MPRPAHAPRRRFRRAGRGDSRTRATRSRARRPRRWAGRRRGAPHRHVDAWPGGAVEGRSGLDRPQRLDGVARAGSDSQRKMLPPDSSDHVTSAIRRHQASASGTSIAAASRPAAEVGQPRALGADRLGHAADGHGEGGARELGLPERAERAGGHDLAAAQHDRRVARARGRRRAPPSGAREAEGPAPLLGRPRVEAEVRLTTTPSVPEGAHVELRGCRSR